MVDFGHTEAAMWNRLAKAHALADNLAASGVRYDVAVALGARGRRGAERLAGVRRCSDETWSIALRRLADREGE